MPIRQAEMAKIAIWAEKSTQNYPKYITQELCIAQKPLNTQINHKGHISSVHFHGVI